MPVDARDLAYDQAYSSGFVGRGQAITHLERGGLTAEDIDSLRARFVDP